MQPEQHLISSQRKVYVRLAATCIQMINHYFSYTQPTGRSIWSAVVNWQSNHNSNKHRTTYAMHFLLLQLLLDITPSPGTRLMTVKCAAVSYLLNVGTRAVIWINIIYQQLYKRIEFQMNFIQNSSIKEVLLDIKKKQEMNRTCVFCLERVNLWTSASKNRSFVELQ